jgi:cytochrome c oxidase subunit IV
MKHEPFTPEQRREIWKEMRVPVFAFIGLMLCLGGIVLLGGLFPSHIGSMIELALLAAMVLTVLLFSMEVLEEAPLLRFFSAYGFAWLAVMIVLTMTDYLTR